MKLGLFLVLRTTARAAAFKRFHSRHLHPFANEKSAGAHRPQQRLVTGKGQQIDVHPLD